VPVEGIHVNVQTPSGSTALLVAAQKGHTEILEMILQVPDIKVSCRDQLSDSLWADSGHERGAI
jgi:hypothetical protein